MDAIKTCPSCHKPLAPNAPDGLCPECLVKAGLPTGADLASPTGQTGGTGGPHGTKILKPPPPLEEIARHFPQFQILECLGRGGMGVVYKARQPKLNRFVALKILAPEKVAEARFAERFEREAQALARLNHSNIVAVHDFGEADGLYYLLMEYVDGVSLRQLLQMRKIAPEEALAIVPKICEALQFAHEQGVVHRDIKPENVLLDKQGRVKIADFGIAKIVGGTEQTIPSPGLTATLSPPNGERAGERGAASLTQDQVLGTPNYMAPEQVEKPHLVDHRADIYSLGVVFYEMLTGELPLGKFQPPSKKVQVDVRLDEVVLHALEREPERRYQQVSEVRSAVETIATTAPKAESEKQKSEIEARTIASAAAIRGMVRVPALGLIVISGLTLLLLVVVLPIWSVGAVISITGKTSGFPWPIVIPMLVAMTGCNVVSLVGAWRMRQLRSYTLAVVGSILFILGPVVGMSSVIVTHGSPRVESAMPVLLGLLFGTWSLIVLSRRDVQEAFQETRPRATTPLGSVAHPGAPSPGSSGGKSAPSEEQGLLTSAARTVKVPAIGIMVISGLTLGLGAISLLAWLNLAIESNLAMLSADPGVANSRWRIVIPLILVMIGGNITSLVGAHRMRQLRSYKLAVVGSILFMLSPWLGLPMAAVVKPSRVIVPPIYWMTPVLVFGTWSLIVLFRRDVREVFKANRVGRTTPPAAATPPFGSSRREEAQAERSAQDQSLLTPAATPSPHFSRTAMAGALWAAGGMLLAAIAVCTGATPNPAGHPIGPALLGSILMAVVYLSAPFGTTILGWVALAQIRRSAGELYGVRLAMFNGLLFPLLVLVTVLLFVWYGVLDWGFPLLQKLGVRQPSLAFSLILWLPWLAGSVALCVWVAQRAQRAINRMPGIAVEPPAPAPERFLWKIAAATVVVLLGLAAFIFWAQQPRLLGGTYASDSPDGRYSAMAQTFHEMRVFGGDKTYYRFTVQGLGGTVFEQWKIPVPTAKLATNYVAMSLAEVIFDVTNRASIQWSKDSQQVSFSVRDVEVFAYDVAARSRTNASAPADALSASFGPVIELLMPVGGPSNIWLNLESGILLPAAEKLFPDQRPAWAEEHDADISASQDDVTHRRQLILCGLFAVTQHDRQRTFEEATAETVVQAAQEIEATLISRPDRLRRQFWGVEADKTPQSVIFKTRHGRVGILQTVTRLSDIPSGVQIRYKLVQARAQQAGKSLVTPKLPALSFGVETKGLCAALELKPFGKGFVLGEPIEVRFHIRNTSTSIISVGGASWRQDEPRYITVQDEQGGTIPVHHIWYSGLSRLQRSVLEPGESAVFRSSSLEFLAKDADEEQVKHPVGNYVRVKPGRYTVSYRLQIPDVKGSHGPMPDDWQGILDTAPVTVHVKAPGARAEAENPSFGPVIEREISSDLVRLTNWWALNLASGKVMRFDLTRPPDDLTSGFAASDPSTLTLDRRLPSLRAAGVDLFQALAASQPDSVLALDLRLVSLDADGWDTSAADAMAQLNKAAAVGVSRSEVFIDGTHVYVFATRGGAKGVLQISKNTSPAKLRYKLLQSPKQPE